MLPVACQPSSPGRFERLAEVPGLDDTGKPDESKVVCTMGVFTHGRGQVFTAATLNWSLGLSQDRRSWNVIDQITRNVFEHLG